MIKLEKLSGAKAHRWQRLSAWYLFLYLPAMALYIVLLPEYNSLENIIINLYYCKFGIATIIALMLVFVHAWIGGRDILIDYIPRNHTNLWLNAYFILLLILAVDLVIMVISLNPYL